MARGPLGAEDSTSSQAPNENGVIFGKIQPKTGASFCDGVASGTSPPGISPPEVDR
jgi:hypothetical protein